tara:strand:- start:341 stop:628 length:288 start_codon:yes stop_codon:yes gene_type:complete
MAYDIRIPDSVLELADKVTLKDLLQSPSFQCFVVSAVGNGVRNSNSFREVMDEGDEFLQFRLHQLMGAIPYETRRACYDEVGRIFQERKDRRHNR